jgi:class 3 adenylate cyclase
LLTLRTQLGFGDLLLVDTEGNIVYSTNKRLDFATNAQTGPYRDTGMGEAVTSRIAAAAVGEAVFVDFELYLPAQGKPSLFVAAAVRDQARTVGTLLVEIPIEGLNALTIGEANWEETGFGETAEVYVVGRDNLMRTDSRLWIEDPDQYLTVLQEEEFDPRIGNLIEIFDSTVLLQPVNTAAVREALDGERFLGRTSNYLGVSSLSASGPVGAGQVDWVVVAELSSEEANAPLRDYVTQILIAGLVMIPIVILLAWFFSGRMTKPVRPVVEAAAAVAEGDLEARVPDLGRNEFGDVARRLNLLTATLAEKEDALAAEEEEIKQLLLSALPSRLVTALRSGDRELLDLVDTATEVAFDVDGIVNGSGIDDEAGVELATEFSRRIESIAESLGIERVRSSTDQHIFAAGLGTPETAVDLAADFALRVVEAIDDFRQSHGVEVTYRAGMSAGHVIAGLLSADELAYGVLGEPSRVALALAGVAGSDQILIDSETAADLEGPWVLETATGLVDLRGNELTAVVLQGRSEQTDREDSTS